MSYLQATCFVQPPVTGEVAVAVTAASAIAVYVEKLQPDIPEGSASVRPLSYLHDSCRDLHKLFV